MTAVLLGLLSAISWGTADFCARFTGRALGALGALFGMFVAGLLMLSLALLLTGRGLPGLGELSLPVTGHAAALLVAMGTLYEGLRRGPISVVAPLAGAYPAWSLAWDVAHGLRPEPLAWAAMIAVMAGAWVVARAEGAPEPEGAPPPPSQGITVVMGLISGVMFAVSLQLARPAIALHGELETLWYARLLGCAVLLAPVLALRALAGLRGRLGGLLLLQGTLDTGGILFLLAGAVSPTATVLSSTFGVVTILLAFLVLKERVHRGQWLGVALVFGGVAGLTALG